MRVTLYILGIDKTQFRILQAELELPLLGLVGVSRGLWPCLFCEAYKDEGWDDLKLGINYRYTQPMSAVATTFVVRDRVSPVKRRFVAATLVESSSTEFNIKPTRYEA